VILAAGLGLRMRPITSDWPKPAIPFLNRPLLHWILETLESAGIQRVFINLHHRPDLVKAAAASFPGGLEFKFSYEPAILGTAGLYGPLRGSLRGESFLAVNGDVLGRFPFLRMEEELSRHPEALAVLALRCGSKPYTPIELYPGGLVRAFGRGDLMFAGAYAARRELLDHLPGPGPAELVAHLLAPLIPVGAVRGLVFEEPWDDLGDAAGYLATSLREVEAIARGFRAAPSGSRLVRISDQPVLVHDAGSVDESATVTGPAIIGEGARVGRGARLGRAVLLPGTDLAPGQALEDAIASPSGRIALGPPPAA
jgi:NDP-sugar pyrophosphorylase family protein